MLDEAATAPTGNGSARAGLIEAPYLQLVLERVWEQERAAGSHLLRLATLERLGGARAIVGAHLERTLGALEPHDAAIAASALTYLVTPSRTKIAQSFDDLVGYTEQPAGELRTVLDVLAAQRILRVASTNGGAEGRRYEIFHDVLAEPVLAWRRTFVAGAALERERETARRRHRGLLAIAVGAGIVAAAMIALAVYAISQSNDAAHQQQVAEQQAQIAKRRTRAAIIAVKKEKKAENSAKASAATATQETQKAQKSATEATQSQAQTKAALTKQQKLAIQLEAQRNAADSSRKRAVHQTGLARQATQRERLEAQRATARADAAQAQALLGVDPVQSLNLALEARKLEKSPLTEDVLRDAVVSDRLRAVLPGGGGPVGQIAFSSDGTRVLEAAAGGGTRLYEAGGKLVKQLGSGKTSAVTFSPDGSLAVTAGSDGVHLWNAKDGASSRTLSFAGAIPALSTGAALAVAISADGRRVAAGGPGGATVWSIDGSALASLPHDGKVTSVALAGRHHRHAQRIDRCRSGRPVHGRGRHGKPIRVGWVGRRQSTCDRLGVGTVWLRADDLRNAVHRRCRGLAPGRRVPGGDCPAGIGFARTGGYVDGDTIGGATLGAALIHLEQPAPPLHPGGIDRRRRRLFHTAVAIVS